ncbi:unnamed protein product [Mytilus coruscus]|uniref:Uncharacterized protein n=1 Tax=Mytilus coruscus TaxID=42192 RepID=A0A6J8ERG7_MYTCO|nr:unnamed protein product [Mytilus coruscus]
MEIQDFINYLRQNDEIKFENYAKFEQVLEAKTSHFFLPQSNLKEQAMIHEKIFKDCVKQAATNCHADDRIWKEFEWFFRDYCKAGGNLKQYGDGMRQAAFVAWNTIRYIQDQPEAGNFGTTLENSIFPGLKEHLLVDFSQPSIIYELKFTELDKDEYEKDCLVNDTVKAVIHFLVSGLKPDRAKLGVLVFYWKINSVVYYATEAHQNEELVVILEEKLSPGNDEHDKNRELDEEEHS